MNSTNIEWCDLTWNPVTGCPGPKVSVGCAHCYAERMANTRLRPYYEKFWGDSGLPDGGPFQRMYLHHDRLDQPRKLKKPSRIFVGSMCDLFHDWSEIMWLQELFRIMEDCPQHTFCLLTKRPERMRYVLGLLAKGALADGQVWPLPNVWLGVTVCNQEEADRLIPVLMEIPAAKRFISLEPLLGPVRLTRWAEEFSPLPGLTDWATFEWPAWVPEKTRKELSGFWNKDHRGAEGYNRQFGGRWAAAPAFGAEMGMPDKPLGFVCHPSHPKAALRGRFIPAWGNIGRLVLPSGEVRVCAFSHGPSYLSLWPQLGKSYDDPHMRRIDWIICGGETGPGARPMHPAWVCSLRDECQLPPVPGVNVPPPVPFFFKGWGEWVDLAQTESRAKWGISQYQPFEDEQPVCRLGKKRAGRLLDGEEWNEVPS